MRNGLAIPVEPKKSWKRWMCDPSEPCPLGGKDCPKPGLLCRRCIYSYFSAVFRKAFYEHCFPSKPKTLPKRDSKGRFCKKEQKGGIGEYFYGLCVPVKPKKEWKDWMLLDGEACPLTCFCCGTEPCKTCIYSFANGEERRAFYRYCFTERKESSLPKLTAEVFDRKDCPEWAQWAAVDSDGQAYFYDSKPFTGDAAWWGDWGDIELTRIDQITFDASDWKNSLIERPKKFPDYSDWKLWEVRVSPSTHRVIRKVPGYEPTKVRFEEKYNNAVFTIESEHLPWDLVPVKITLLPPEELIGKTVVDCRGNYTTVISISENKDWIAVYDIDRGQVMKVSLKFFFFEFHLPNGLYVASIEKA